MSFNSKLLALLANFHSLSISAGFYLNILEHTASTQQMFNCSIVLYCFVNLYSAFHEQSNKNIREMASVHFLELIHFSGDLSNKPTYAEIASLHWVRGDIVGVDENCRNSPPHLLAIVWAASESDKNLSNLVGELGKLFVHVVSPLFFCLCPKINMCLSKMPSGEGRHIRWCSKVCSSTICLFRIFMYTC